MQLCNEEVTLKFHRKYLTHTFERNIFSTVVALWDRRAHKRFSNGPHGHRHYTDVRMSTMASQITSLTVVYSTVYSGTEQRKHKSSASLAFVRGIHRWPVNSPHKRPVTPKMSPFDDVIMMAVADALSVLAPNRQHAISNHHAHSTMNSIVVCIQIRMYIKSRKNGLDIFSCIVDIIYDRWICQLDMQVDISVAIGNGINSYHSITGFLKTTGLKYQNQ